MGTERKTYYAKSANEFHDRIKNSDHLQRVGKLARKFGAEIGKAAAAGIAGDYHDFGKYGESFQGVLDGTHQGIDHAFPSAAYLYHRIDENWKDNGSWVPILEAVAGHHDGLVGISEMDNELHRVYHNARVEECPSRKHPSLRGAAAFSQAEAAFREDFPDRTFPRLRPRHADERGSVGTMLDTRMLFSCLVDADYSVSASDDDPEYLKKNSRPPLEAKEMLGKLEAHCAKLRANSTADPKINALRREVYHRCGAAGAKPMGVFTLTAPTGVGKTMAMLHFALRHCMEHSLKRIITVLPFLTLAEQTEKEYREIFPDVLVDHSQANLPEASRILASRWDSPVIITTSVRFFESLFSDNPRDCRKLHHIAGSVVLFDEAQSLPASLAKPTVEAVQALCRKYRCTMVFSTATQPDFGALPGTTWKPTEILPDNAVLFQKMRRVHTVWRNRMSLGAVAVEMCAQKNVCCIVNLRRHARILFEALKKQQGSGDGLFFLTSDLCPAHRLQVIAEIRERQSRGEPCLLVATQCMEAGVDLDFHVVYRALAPLESIIQAAGRCNRNGKAAGGGKVVVFYPEEAGNLYPGTTYGKAAGIVSSLWDGCGEPELSDLEQIHSYYSRFFGNVTEDKELREAIEFKDYRQAARKYCLVQNAGVSLIVPWGGKAELFQKAAQSVRSGKVNGELLRETAPITISCFHEEAVRSCATPVRIRKGREVVETGTYILNEGFEEKYDPVTGFALTEGTTRMELLMT